MFPFCQAKIKLLLSISSILSPYFYLALVDREPKFLAGNLQSFSLQRSGNRGGMLRLKVSAMDWKTMHNLKVENCVLFSGLAEDYSPGYSLSDSSEELFQRDKAGATIYRSFYWKTKPKTNMCTWTSKVTVNHKNRPLKLIILVLFYVW